MSNTIMTDAAHQDIDTIFREILPQLGMDVREGQIRLCHDMYDALSSKRIALCDAGVGIGKTTAYLAAAVMLNKYHPHDQAVMDYYGEGCAERMPFLITTSSIALQQAILEEYIPFLSDTLLQNDMISEPFTGQMQKGKENYVCRARLRLRLAGCDPANKNARSMDALLALNNEKDLDKVPHLSRYDRQRVCVPRKCPPDCNVALACPYRQYIRKTKKAPALFQVCNHHYFLADALHGEHGYTPLLPFYRAAIIDEAHQLYAAVQSMCGKEVSWDIIHELIAELKTARFNADANKLRMAFEGLFNAFHTHAQQNAVYRKDAECRQALKGVTGLLRDVLLQTDARKHSQIQSRIKDIAATLECFYSGDERYVCFAEWQDGSTVLRCVEKNYRTRLNRLLWGRPHGIILTSGTLAAGHDMEFFKSRMGLMQKPGLMESITSSPFDYQRNSLLYFPPNMPPCNNTGAFRTAAANQIEKLIQKTSGHTLVLCTSYTEMHEIFQKLQSQNLPFPLFAMHRGGRQYLDAFRASGNGVLITAGSCWEGMDFPGDLVSSLIIVRLPFPRRDALHEGEKDRFMDIRDFVQAVAVPEMQVKLRQGFGRGIRLMTDTCAISIVDGRAGPKGMFHKTVLDALPSCPITQNLDDVEMFIQTRKTAGYFVEASHACAE